MVPEAKKQKKAFKEATTYGRKLRIMERDFDPRVCPAVNLRRRQSDAVLNAVACEMARGPRGVVPARATTQNTQQMLVHARDQPSPQEVATRNIVFSAVFEDGALTKGSRDPCCYCFRV